MIALVTRASDAAEHDILTRLRLTMPHQTLQSLRQIAPQDYAKVDIAIVANPDPADLARLPNLVWVQSMWAGVERMLAELSDFAPPIVRLVDPELTRTMAEAVLSWSLYLFRDMPSYRVQQNAKHWQQLPYRKPQNVTIGLLGLGVLGQAAAQVLAQAGFNLVGWSKTKKNLPHLETVHGDEGLRHILGQSDIIVSLLPLTPQTKGLLNQTRFAQMKPGAELINFGRGALIDDDDLLAALDQGQLKHAVLDVFAKEPLDVDHPYWDHPKVTVLPHISAITDPETAAEIIAKNIETYRKQGIIPQAVDRERGY